MADYVLPSLGADMESATLVEWLVAPGDAVRKGQVVGTVETEKAVMDIEFFQDGRVEEILVPVGQKVTVGTPLLRFLPHRERVAGRREATAEPVAPAVQAAEAAEPQPSEPVGRVTPSVERLARELGVDLATVTGTAPGGRITRDDVRAATVPATRASEAVPVPPAPAPVETPIQHAAPAGAAPSAVQSRPPVSPLARRFAEEHGIDLADVQATGPNGSITLDDVQRAVPAAVPPTSAISAQGPSAQPALPPGPVAARTAERQLAMRRSIAALMARSKREIPHYYLALDIDLSRPLAWLTDENARRPMADRLLPAVLLVRATALALRDIPELNGFWIDDRFEPGTGIHAGIAISLRGGGLVAPAIHDADQKTLGELMAAMRDLVARARAGTLHRAEMADPTVTITNLGDQGVDAVHGVIYPPQVALIGFGRVRERPVAVDGLVGVRPVVTATLAADHRNSDGHRGGLLLAAIDRHLQAPEEP